MNRVLGQKHYEVGTLVWVLALVVLITVRFQGYVTTPWSVVLAPIWVLPAVLLSWWIVRALLLYFAWVIYIGLE